MNRELKAKWLDALRSGKYAQGMEQLRCNDKFCCLGVLCDLENPKGWADQEWFYGEDEDRDSEVGTLPFAFRVKVGISAPVEATLIRMNDGGMSFAQIADWIEANL